MVNLMDSLGLDKVEADPNALPDGKWAGIVSKSEYVHVKKNETFAHVVTYKVTLGERKGAERQVWYTLGKDPQFDDNGNCIGFTPTLSDSQKPWYKKMFVDLGIPESQVPNAKPEDIVGKLVTFGTKKNGEFINVNFVELRADTSPEAQAVAAASAISGETTPEDPAPGLSGTLGI